MQLITLTILPACFDNSSTTVVLSLPTESPKSYHYYYFQFLFDQFSSYSLLGRTPKRELLGLILKHVFMSLMPFLAPKQQQ